MTYPLTGPYSVEGLDQIRAARLAVDEINAAGGVLGRRIVLLTRDSASDVLLTELNVEELIGQGCVMIFGGSSSAAAIVASEICAKRKIPFFGTLTYSTSTTLENGRRFTFRECGDSWMAANALAGRLNAQYAGKRYFYITADYTWGWTTEESMRQVTGTTDRKKHPGVLKPLGAVDFSDALEAAGSNDPDVLVLTLFGKDMAHALRQAVDMGLKSRAQVVVPNLTLGMAERAGPKAMEGVLGATFWTWKAPYQYGYPRGKKFVEAFVGRYRRYPSTSGASAYSIVYEYVDAVKRSGSLASEGVIKALEGHKYRLLKDEQVWRALDHQSVQTVYTVQGNPISAVLADPLRLDLFTILGAMPGNEAVRSESEWKRLRVKAGLPPFLERFPGEAAP
jgi:ABC-type branched-subunit amino acid transport system substrate-binding protein